MLKFNVTNSINWYSWNFKTFQIAQEKDLPLFINISCFSSYWGRKMTKESFEDLEIIKLLNQHFIAIKINQDEHPNINTFYFNIIHLMGIESGWPLNMFCFSNGIPFFGGNYFPLKEQYSTKSFKSILLEMINIWKNKRLKFKDYSQRIIKVNDELFQDFIENKTQIDPFFQEDKSFADLHKEYYDQEFGGFKFQPRCKFLLYLNLLHLLKIFSSSKDTFLLEIVENTIRCVKSGGIYDQIGGGISRLSNDYQWKFPDFEKILYENSLLIQLLVKIFIVTKKDFYLKWTMEVVSFLETEMIFKENTHSQGFFSSINGYKQEEKDNIYLWTTKELKELLTTKEMQLISNYYSIKENGNIDYFSKKNLLFIEKNSESIKEDLSFSQETKNTILKSAQKKLKEQRSKRKQPIKNQKIIAEWNALMVSSLIELFKVKQEPIILRKAKKVMTFLSNHLLLPSGGVCRYWFNGQVSSLGTLADHSFFVKALLDLYEVTTEIKWLKMAQEIMDFILQEFYENNCFFDTARSTSLSNLHSSIKPIQYFDNVIPCGNSITVHILLKFFVYFLNEKYHKIFLNIISNFSKLLATNTLPYMLSVLHDYKKGIFSIIVVGDLKNPQMKDFLNIIYSNYNTAIVTIILKKQTIFPPLLSNKAIKDKPYVLISSKNKSSLPIFSSQELLKSLQSNIKF